MRNVWSQVGLKPWLHRMDLLTVIANAPDSFMKFVYNRKTLTIEWLKQHSCKLQTANLKSINLTTASIHSPSSWNICIMKLDRIQCVSTVWQVRNRTISVDSFRSWKFIWNKNISNRKHETSKHLSIFHLFVIFIHINLYTNVFVLVN